MDGDGEDRPEELSLLIKKTKDYPDIVITADSVKRSEGFIFKFCNLAHKYLTLIFTGQTIKFGNYTCLPKFLVNEMINCFLLDYRGNIDKNVGLCLELIKITDIKDTNYQFNNAYTRYIKNLTCKLPIVLNDNVGMIGHIGDSHCLSIAHHELQISGKIYRIQPLICFGLKSYHLGVQTANNYQSIVKQYMSVLPKKSIIFLSVGEIDCRFEEGILLHLGKNADQFKKLLKIPSSYIFHG